MQYGALSAGSLALAKWRVRSDRATAWRWASDCFMGILWIFAEVLVLLVYPRSTTYTPPHYLNVCTTPDEEVSAVHDRPGRWV